MCRADLAASGILSLIQNQTVERTELKAVSKSNAFSIMVQAFHHYGFKKCRLALPEIRDASRWFTLTETFPSFLKDAGIFNFCGFFVIYPGEKSTQEGDAKKDACRASC